MVQKGSEKGSKKVQKEITKKTISLFFKLMFFFIYSFFAKPITICKYCNWFSGKPTCKIRFSIIIVKRSNTLKAAGSMEKLLSKFN